MRVLVFLLVACSGGEKRGTGFTAVQPDDANQGTGPGLADAALVAVPVDGEPVAAPVDAAVATRECFCFSWVHLDENGEYCFEAKPKCDKEFAAFGRDMKIECSSQQRPTCFSHACRKIGKECVRL